MEKLHFCFLNVKAQKQAHNYYAKFSIYFNRHYIMKYSNQDSISKKKDIVTLLSW